MKAENQNMMSCPDCKGSATDPAAVDQVCRKCSGEGRIPELGRRWRLPDGRLLWVGKAFDAFMTFCSDPNAGGRHRFKSKNLPPRATIEEAQADLDAWASKGELVEVDR